MHMHDVFINVNPQCALLFFSFNVNFEYVFEYFMRSGHNLYRYMDSHGFLLLVLHLANNSNEAMANITSLNHEIKYDVSLLCKCHLMLKLWIAPCSYGELQKKLNVKLDCALRL